MDKRFIRSNLKSVLTGFYWLKIGLCWDFPVTKSSNIKNITKQILTPDFEQFGFIASRTQGGAAHTHQPVLNISRNTTIYQSSISCIIYNRFTATLPPAERTKSAYSVADISSGSVATRLR